MPTNGWACLRIARRDAEVGEKVMKVLLTGGSGNLGQTLVPRLLDQGDTAVILDVRAPRDLKKGALFIEGTILDRARLTDIFRGCDCIVHIAAWHGIHESRGEKNSYDFFDLNVRGTFEVFEAAASARIIHGGRQQETPSADPLGESCSSPTAPWCTNHSTLPHYALTSAKSDRLLGARRATLCRDPAQLLEPVGDALGRLTPDV
jgi:nucleoside-diphosphate-sugar epimerase